MSVCLCVRLFNGLSNGLFLSVSFLARLFVCVCVLVCLSVFLPVCVCWFACQIVCLLVCISVYFCKFVSLFLCQFVFLSVGFFLCLPVSVDLSVCRCV